MLHCCQKQSIIFVRLDLSTDPDNVFFILERYVGIDFRNNIIHADDTKRYIYIQGNFEQIVTIFEKENL